MTSKTTRSLAESNVANGKDPGYKELQRILEASFTERWGPDDLAEAIGMKGLNWLIKTVLDEHYPEDIFGANTLYPTWSSEKGGEDIDPGVRWILLLRQALKEVE